MEAKYYLIIVLSLIIFAVGLLIVNIIYSAKKKVAVEDIPEINDMCYKMYQNINCSKTRSSVRMAYGKVVTLEIYEEHRKEVDGLDLPKGEE